VLSFVSAIILRSSERIVGYSNPNGEDPAKFRIAGYAGIDAIKDGVKSTYQGSKTESPSRMHQGPTVALTKTRKTTSQARAQWHSNRTSK